MPPTLPPATPTPPPDAVANSGAAASTNEHDAHTNPQPTPPPLPYRIGLGRGHNSNTITNTSTNTDDDVAPTAKLSLLNLDPDHTLTFKQAPNSTMSCILEVSNLGHGYAAFKIKTSAPKCYLVTPSTGVLAPKETTEIELTLQPNYELCPDRRRFLVQAIEVMSKDTPNREQWADPKVKYPLAIEAQPK